MGSPEGIQKGAFSREGRADVSQLMTPVSRDGANPVQRVWSMLRRRSESRSLQEPGHDNQQIIGGTVPKEFSPQGDSLGPVRPDGSRRKEQVFPESFRPIEPRDIQTMIDDKWFEDPGRIVGIWGNLINSKTLPAVWNDETRARFRDEVLMPFYFGGPMTIEAKDEKGNLRRVVEDVTRTTMVMEWKGKLVAARSYLSCDPWAPENEWRQWGNITAHAQMLITAPGNEGHGYGTILAAKVHEDMESKGLTRVVTLVNIAGINYGKQETFFRDLGFKEKGLIKIKPSDVDSVITCRKFVSTQADRKANNANKEKNPYIRWANNRRENEYADLRQSAGKPQ